MNALANPEVGKFLNEYFVSSFQKVATFKIVNGQKQGGNVASYFCAPDGRVLHCIAGPVDANTFLQEAKWVVETTKLAMKEAADDGAKFKAFFRKAHADKLQRETGLVVEPTTYDWSPPSENDALQFRDPTGRPLAPKLPPPPIDGPDVKLQDKELALRQANAAKAPNTAGMPAYCTDRGGRRWNIGNQGKADQIMAAHCMAKIESIYGTIFENIL
ncbi:MAG TPA: hypothetical protein VGZ47_22495, partial [Gemmataceae bacterium]|nr:hypothetical protein [Gemmataceae bacterium]